MNYDQFIRELDAAPLAPAYVVAGDDTVAIDNAVDRLLRKALDGQDPTGILDRHDGREVEPVAVLDALLTLPLFGSRRIVLVDHADAFLEAAGPAIQSYLNRPSPSPSAVLMLVARGVSAPARTFKAYAKAAVVVGCAAPRRVGDRVRWLVQRAAEQGKRLSGADARLLLELVGNDLGALASEIEKIATYIGTRKAIRRADIEALVAPVRVEPVYQLGDAVTARDLPRAIHLVEDLLNERVPLPLILGALRSHLRRFWQLKRQHDAGRSPAQAAREIGEANRTWLVEKLYRQVDRFTDADLARCFSELLSADVATKTGALPDAVALERFVSVACGRD